jgi:GTP-binding protein EngB required for normal cell division
MILKLPRAAISADHLKVPAHIKLSTLLVDRKKRMKDTERKTAVPWDLLSETGRKANTQPTKVDELPTRRSEKDCLRKKACEGKAR